MGLKGRNATLAERRAMGYIRLMHQRWEVLTTEICDIEAHKQRRVEAGKEAWTARQTCSECHIEFINEQSKLIFWAMVGEEMDSTNPDLPKVSLPTRRKGTVSHELHPSSLPDEDTPARADTGPEAGPQG